MIYNGTSKSVMSRLPQTSTINSDPYRKVIYFKLVLCILNTKKSHLFSVQRLETHIILW